MEEKTRDYGLIDIFICVFFEFKIMNIAVFIDRDGVINELKNYEEAVYVTKEKDIKLIDKAAEGIKKLNEKNIKVIVISNQSQVAKGLVTIDGINKINQHLNNLLKNKGAKIDEFYFCPHHPNNGVNEYCVECECRKPKPGLILKASKENKIDIKKSYMIGDRIIDIKAGKSAGCKINIGVRTGYGCNDSSDDIPDIVVENLLYACEFVLEDLNATFN